MADRRTQGLACVVIACAVVPVHAAYNANITGVVTWVSSYTDADYIYFHLENQPTAHSQCNPAYFVIDANVPENRRNQAFAQLLAARYSGEPIAVGYDAQGDCAQGYIRVHRIG